MYMIAESILYGKVDEGMVFLVTYSLGLMEPEGIRKDKT